MQLTTSSSEALKNSGAMAAPGAAPRFDAQSRISDVAADPLFEGYGRLLFPLHRGYMGGSTLGQLTLTWYSHLTSSPL